MWDENDMRFVVVFAMANSKISVVDKAQVNINLFKF